MARTQKTGLRRTILRRAILRRTILRRTIGCSALALTALLASSCGGALAEVGPVGPTTTYHGRVIAARGPTMARDGGTCVVQVRGADDGFLNCRIRVRCNDDVIYGLSGSGFNNCRSDDDRFIFAHDHSGTRRDGDPRMFFDLLAGRVIISDDDPDVEILVDLMNDPPGY